MSLFDAVAGALSWLEPGALAVKIAATMALVVAVGWSVKILGPTIGGILVGLPVTIGPGLYFLATQYGLGFASRSATYSLFSLSATQSFLLVYILSSTRYRPWLCICHASAAWVIGAALLRMVPPSAPLGLVLFALVSATYITISKHVQIANLEKPGAARGTSLLLRAGLAGLLVAAITTAGHELGPALAGLILPYPVIYSVTALTVHQQMGRSTVIATLSSALFGTISTAGFCAVLSTFARSHAIAPSFALALCAALSISSVMVAASRVRRRHRN
ncbi:hypothetical protein CDEF62S_06325 [Castellaniella defragrans]